VRDLSDKTRIARPWMSMHPAITSLLQGHTVSWVLRPRPSVLHTFTQRLWFRTCPSICIFPCIVDDYLPTSRLVVDPDCSACRRCSRMCCFYIHHHLHSRACSSLIPPYRETPPANPGQFSLPATPTSCSKNKRGRTTLAIEP
jgi:hypothetical protein